MRKNFVTSQGAAETGNWNIAGYYALNKIALPSIKLDEYEIIARFGTNELIEEFTTDEQIKTMARIKALERMAHMLTLLISNTRFAVKADNKLKLDEYEIDIQKIQKSIPLVQMKKYNQRDKTNLIKIDEVRFNYILNMLVKIKKELNEPLNEASLIFTNIEDYDVDKMKEDYINQLMKSG